MSYSSTQDNDTDEGGSIDFTLRYSSNGPIVAAALSVLLLLQLAANSFIVIYTLLHSTALKKESSMVLFFGLAITNLLGTTTLVFPLVTSAAGEWVFGRTVAEKEAVCKFNGYIALVTFNLRNGMLAMVSVDRFFKLVKPLLHKQYFKSKKVAIVMIVSWIAVALPSTIPLYQDNVFRFGPALYFCSITSIVHYMVILLVVSIVIAISSTWTCLFARSSLKRDHSLRHVSATSDQDREDNDHIYNVKVCKVFGIFSIMLMLQFVSIASVFSVGITLFTTGHNPVVLVRSVYIFGNTLQGVCKPLLQCYFRKDMWEDICRCAKATGRCVWHKKHHHQETGTKAHACQEPGIKDDVMASTTV